MGFKVVDYSEYLIWLAFVLCLVSLIFNAIYAETFDIVISFILGLIFGICLFKIRKFGKAQVIMESVSQMKQENERLNETIVDLSNIKMNLEEQTNVLEEQNCEIKKEVSDLRRLMKIFDNNNKTAEEIQKDLLGTLDKLTRENRKYEKLNKGHAFLVADINHDGVLNDQEQNILKNITSDNEIKTLDSNRDNVVSRDEYVSHSTSNTTYKTF